MKTEEELIWEAYIHPQLADIKEIATLYRSAQSRTEMTAHELELMATGLKDYGRLGLRGYIYVSFQRPATDISLGIDGVTARDTQEGWGFLATPTPLSVQQIKDKRIAPIGKALNAAVSDTVFSGLMIEVETANGEFVNYLWTTDPSTQELRITQIDKEGPWGHYSKDTALNSFPPTWADPEKWIGGKFFDERPNINK